MSMSNDRRLPAVRFRDLSIKDEEFRQALLQAFERVLAHGQFIEGPEVEAFEATVARFCGTRYCVGVASGTSALYLALRAYGIGPGDEVITSALSWVATANAIGAARATPVFGDIGWDLNIDPTTIEPLITARTKAIVPVHFTGRLCVMDEIGAIAEKFDLLVIEDAAQAMGAQLPDGRRAGGLGHAGAFSLNPMKVLAGFGEAGAVATDDEDVATKIRMLRYLGTRDREECFARELNHKIDALQAALLQESFGVLDSMIEARYSIAAAYDNGLSDVVTCPPLPAQGDRSAIFFDYTVLAEERDALQRFLSERSIETKVRHPILMPDQPAYRELGRPAVPVARQAVGSVLSLPCHEKLSAEQVATVVEAVRAFYAKR